MANTEQDELYISNALDYNPSIKDNWKSENIIGTNDGEIDIVDALEGPSLIDSEKDPFKNEEARDEIILNNSKTTITKESIYSAINFLSELKETFSSSIEDYSHTSYIIDHSINFWNSMDRLVDWFSLTEEDIDKYKETCEKEKGMYLNLGKLVAILSVPNSYKDESQEMSNALKEYDEQNEELKKIAITKDSQRTKCFMSSDINRSVMMYSSDCQRICQNTLGAPDSELSALDSSAADTFIGLSKEEVEGISGVMSDEFMNDIVSLKRVADLGTDEYSVNSHINNIERLASYKMDVMPKMKHIMRNNQSKSDFTNMVINDMLDKCKSVDDKYKTSLVTTVKYMHAENTILLKTFVSETKLNRFKMASDYMEL